MVKKKSTGSTFNFLSYLLMPTTIWSTRVEEDMQRAQRGLTAINKWASLSMELHPEKQNQTEQEEQQTPGFWQSSTEHSLTSDFSLKPCGTGPNKSIHLQPALDTSWWSFATKDTFGCKNAAELVLVKTLGSTYPRDQGSEGFDYSLPGTQWTAVCRWEQELVSFT